jgi:hypothetical protein
LSAVLNTIQNANAQSERRLNQMIQEQCRTRCGTGGGRFANAVTAQSRLLEVIANLSAGDAKATGNCASKVRCSLPIALRSAGRTLQLQARDCNRAQPSEAVLASEGRTVCCWQQGRCVCVAKVPMGHNRALLTSVLQQRQYDGGGTMSATAAKYANAWRTVADVWTATPIMPELSHGRENRQAGRSKNPEGTRSTEKKGLKRVY